MNPLLPDGPRDGGFHRRIEASVRLEIHSHDRYARGTHRHGRVRTAQTPSAEDTTRQPEQWQFDGNPNERYELYLVPAKFGPWAADLVSLGDPQPGESVPDVACGTGSVTRLIVPRVGAAGKVVGLNLNVGRLAVARSLSSALADYCVAFSMWVEANQEIENEGATILTPTGLKRSPWVSIAGQAWKEMTRMLSEFGMSPASRTKAQIVEKPFDIGGRDWFGDRKN